MKRRNDCKKSWRLLKTNLELLKAQITLKRQHIQTLHVQLQDLSKEHSEELAVEHISGSSQNNS